MLLSLNTNKQGFSEEEREPRRIHYYEKGEDIPTESHGLWQVCRGIVQLSKPHVSGEEVLLGWIQPIGFFGICLNYNDVYQAKALSDVYLKWYYPEEIEKSSTLSYSVLQQMLNRIRQTENLLAIASLRKVEERLLELLVFLAEEMGKVTAEGKRIEGRLTHQNLANAIGTTRVTVTRLLGEFQRQGWLKVDGDRHLIIVNFPNGSAI